MGFSGKHIFFDLDRTLWDFEKNSEQALRLLYEAKNMNFGIPSFEKFHKEYFNKNKALWHAYAKGKISKESLRYERFRATFKRFQIHDEHLVKYFGDGYVDLSPKQTRLMPYAQEVLRDLSSMGFTLHIITNGFLEVQHVKLKHAAIDHHFQSVVCSEEVGVNKPDPKIFRYAMNNVGATPSHSLMVGDDYRADVAGSMKAGMKAIWFQAKLNQKSKFENIVSSLDEIPLIAAKLMA